MRDRRDPTVKVLAPLTRWLSMPGRFTPEGRKGLKWKLPVVQPPRALKKRPPLDMACIHDGGQSEAMALQQRLCRRFYLPLHWRIPLARLLGCRRHEDRDQGVSPKAARQILMALKTAPR